VTSAGWTTLRVRTGVDRTAVIRALFALGAEAVQELDAEVVTHLRVVDGARAGELLRAADPGADIAFSPTPDIDWSQAWRSQLKAQRVGAIVVTPPWFADDHPAAERIVIDPGMAFGTGDHETTRGVLRLLPDVLRVGDVVADLGAGSAVLAIAAAKLGARHAYAIEIDPDAIGNAESNVARNGVGKAVSVLTGDAAVLLPLVAPVHVVLANIITSVLSDMLPMIAASLVPGGRAILSGILADEAPRMREALDAGGWRIVTTSQEGSWWTAAIVRA
jgi:ribosomal protein L11 methyltransferase